MRNTSPRPVVPSLIVTLKTGLLRKTLQPAKPRPKPIIAPNSNSVQNAKQASPTPSEQQEQIQSPSHNKNPPPTTKDVIKSLQPESQSGSEASNIGSDPASHARSNHTESQVQQETEQNSKSCQTPQILPADPAASQVTKLDKYLAQLFAVDAEHTISNAAELLKETKASTFTCRIAPTANKIKGNASTSGVYNVLRAALDSIREQLPAVTDAFTSEMRNHVLDLAHCAHVDGTMRIREVREIVVTIKVSLESLLGNLTIVERIANPWASGSAAESGLNADREDDPDEEMVDATVDMDNGGW